MKKFLTILLTLIMCLSLVACGGGSSEGGEEGGESGDDEIKVVYFTAFRGDQGLSDLGYAAITSICSELGVEPTVVEYGQYDAALATNSFWDTVESNDWDVLFGYDWYISDIVDEVAGQHPDTSFLFFDVSKDAGYTAPNVYGVAFAQNESSFMAGLIQALMQKEGKLGCLGSDGNILNDFLTGWLAGVRYAQQELGLAVEEDWTYMPETSMQVVQELMKKLYADGCVSVWPITAQMMLAAAAAAEEKGGIENGYFILGCDYDQYTTYKEKASSGDSTAVGYENILTSITKNIETVGYKLMKDILVDKTGKYESGIHNWRVYEDGVGYLENENFKQWVPADIQAQLKDIIAKIGAGEITVPSFFDFADYDAFAAWRDNKSASWTGK